MSAPLLPLIKHLLPPLLLFESYCNGTIHIYTHNIYILIHATTQHNTTQHIFFSLCINHFVCISYQVPEKTGPEAKTHLLSVVRPIQLRVGKLLRQLLDLNSDEILANPDLVNYLRCFIRGYVDQIQLGKLLSGGVRILQFWTLPNYSIHTTLDIST